MANKKITELSALAAQPADDDLLVIVDVSEGAEANKTKKITFANGVKKYVDDNAGGDVEGPASATDGAIVLFDGITGKKVKNSTTQESDIVKISGNQDVGGVKTFTSFPVTPNAAPTTDLQVANKKYVDDNTGGDVEGPASATDGAIVLFDGITGKLLKNSTTLESEIVKLSGNQTVAGIKTFTSIPVLPASNPTTDNQAARMKYIVDTYVALAGNQTVAGIKTFSSFPVTPSSAPSTDYQVANKKYVDDNAGGGGTDLGIFNVKDPTYGATGNGSTDDRAAIQSAIDAAEAAGGGIVYFPPGTYMIGSTLTIDNNGVTLVGGGQGISYNYYTTNAPAGHCMIKATSGFTTTLAMIYFNTVDGVGMKDIMLHGNSRAEFLMDVRNVYNSHFENINGVLWNGTTNSYAVTLRNDSGTGKGTNNQYWANCHFVRPAGSDGSGLSLNYVSTYTMCEIRFVGCVFTASNDAFGASGPHVVRIGACDHITFLGCHFQFHQDPAVSPTPMATGFCSFYVCPTSPYYFPSSITFIGSPHYGGITNSGNWTPYYDLPALIFWPYYTGDGQPIPPKNSAGTSNLPLKLVAGVTEKGIGLGFPATWTTLSYNTYWGAVSGYVALQYMKDGSGFVHLKGSAIRSSGTSAVIATLPASYRPLNACWFKTKNGYSGEIAEIVVSANGEISIGSGTATTFVGLDGITFMAEG